MLSCFCRISPGGGEPRGSGGTVRSLRLEQIDMPDRIKKVTAKDIAAVVGVSRQAVSAVLSGSNPGCVTLATRQRIRAVAGELGYRPDTAALRLGGHKTKQIGLLLGSYGFVLGYPQFLVNEFRSLGYRPLLMIASDAEEADDAAAELQAGAFDGIFIATRTRWKQSDFRIPVVMQEFGDRDLGMDFAASGRTAVRHLLDQGYRKLLFLSMMPYPSVDEKFAGACAEAGAELRHLCARQETDFEKALLTELDTPYRVGLVCTDDILAARVLLFLRERHFALPEQVGVIGYGGYDYGSMLDPTLTTLVYPAQEFARIAARLLIDKIRSNTCVPLDKPILLKPTLRLGGSTVAGNPLPPSLNQVLHHTIAPLTEERKRG